MAPAVRHTMLTQLGARVRRSAREEGAGTTIYGREHGYALCEGSKHVPDLNHRAA